MYLQEVSALYSVKPILSTRDAAELLRQEFYDAEREYFIALYLDAGGRPISYHIAGVGCVNSVHFGTTSIFKVALLQNAVSIILCHNHPGGCLTPSNEDLTATKDMVKVGEMLGVRVLDHIILTPDNYTCLRETNGEIFVK